MKTSFMHYMRSIAMSQLVINFEQFQPFKRQSN